MTTNLFVIANVKHLRTDGSFRILLPFFQTPWGVGFLNSAIFKSIHNGVEFGTILEGLRNFGGGGGVGGEGLKPQTPLLGTPLSVALLVYAPRSMEIASTGAQFFFLPPKFKASLPNSRRHRSDVKEVPSAGLHSPHSSGVT